MMLTAEQQRMVAMVYEKAAADTIGVPAPQRAAFARKAKRFRTLARIARQLANQRLWWENGFASPIFSTPIRIAVNC